MIFNINIFKVFFAYSTIINSLGLLIGTISILANSYNSIIFYLININRILIIRKRYNIQKNFNIINNSKKLIITTYNINLIKLFNSYFIKKGKIIKILKVIL